MLQLEAAQERAAGLETELASASTASKRKNGSAWRLRQENQQLKAELATKSATLADEFAGKQELRAAAEAA